MDKKQTSLALALWLILTRSGSKKALRRRIAQLFVSFHRDMKERDIDAAIPGVMTLLAILGASVAIFIALLYWIFM